MSTTFFDVTNVSLSRRETILLRMLEREYNNEILHNALLPFLNHTSPISLRALDWAVVNWSKKHNIICSSPTPGRMTNIHSAYRTSLAFWRRRLFDPFRRRTRIHIHINGDTFETTLGQANFALWVHRSGVLHYVLANLATIETDMNQVSRRHKKERREALRNGIKRKRSELTKKTYTQCVAYPAPKLVSFCST